MASYALDNSDVKEIKDDCRACNGTMIGTRHYDHEVKPNLHVFTSYWTDITQFDGNTNVFKWICKNEGAYSRTTMKGLNEWFDRIHVSKHLSIKDVRMASANGFPDEIVSY